MTIICPTRALLKKLLYFSQALVAILFFLYQRCSCQIQNNIGTMNTEMISTTNPPNAGIAIGAMISDPLPLAVRIGR